MSNDIKQTLVELLPSGWDLEQKRGHLSRISEDVHELGATFNKAVRDTSYSDQYPEGPIEIQIDMTGIEDRLDSIKSDTAYLPEIAQDVSLIERNTSVLPEMSQDIGAIKENSAQMTGTLEDIRDLQKWSLGKLALGIGLQQYANNKIIKGQKRSEFFLKSINRSIGQLSFDIDEGFDDIVDSMEDLYDLTEEGFNFIGAELRDGFNFIGAELRDGFNFIGAGLKEIYEGQLKQTGIILTQLDEIRQGLTALDQSQQRRLEELVSTIKEVGSTEFHRRAIEKYIAARELYEIEKYGLAIREVSQALEKERTHLPSLLLYGELCEVYGQWKMAKDSYNLARRLSLKRKDTQAYQISVLNLSSLERKLGNTERSEDIITEALERYKDKDLPRKSKLFELRRARMYNLVKRASKDPRYPTTEITEELSAMRGTDMRHDGGLWEDILCNPTYEWIREADNLRSLTTPLIMGPYRTLYKFVEMFDEPFDVLDLGIEFYTAARLLKEMLEVIVQPENEDLRKNKGLKKILSNVQSHVLGYKLIFEDLADKEYQINTYIKEGGDQKWVQTSKKRKEIYLAWGDHAFKRTFAPAVCQLVMVDPRRLTVDPACTHEIVTNYLEHNPQRV